MTPQDILARRRDERIAIAGLQVVFVALCAVGVAAKLAAWNILPQWVTTVCDVPALGFLYRVGLVCPAA